MDVINPERCDTAPAAEWLLEGARSALEPEQVLTELCNRLLACGLPLARLAVLVRTLHPEVVGRRLTWRKGAGVEALAAPYRILDTPEYQNSPFAYVLSTRQGFRRRLADPDCPLDFPVLAELRDQEGVTDYLATPLIFTDETVHVAVWSTRQPGGFTEAQIAGIEAVVVPLARVTEIRALQRTATNLLATYVGHKAGARILHGQIRRGHTEAIEAAIWLSDMRGFTASSDRLPLPMLIELLNAYFDCQVPAILEAGGEVLKFMGDGLLAIFPIDGAEPGPICARAFTAALEARRRINLMTIPQELAAEAGIRFGLALHIGHVLYGNIGGGNRLDFTCIGPAVNLAARLEKLAGKQGRTVVASRDFAAQVPGSLEPIGEFEIAGLTAPQPVFGIQESELGNH